MKRAILLLSATLSAVIFSHAQDTFSICAVDTVTGEVGGAGASCIDDSQIAGGVVIINDILPGRGVIHTQSYWLAANQNNAHAQMLGGSSPQQLMAWLQANDVQGNPAIRQYGAVDFDSSGSARSAAFTGANCLNYKNHIVGPNYAIQGNILLGQQILDSMEARFLNAQGDLACKLMAALQGAKVIGADTRCTNSGNSSLSSFLRVAQTNDVMPNIYLNLVVKSGPTGYEPIDSLQTLFNAAHNCLTGIDEVQVSGFKLQVKPNPAKDNVTFVLEGTSGENFTVEIYNPLGQKVLSEEVKAGTEQAITISFLDKGLYLYKVITKEGRSVSGKLAKD